ncbi:MAG TPA: rod shape-determining protein MreC [Lentisphaeria bacterium]|nr:rod shape-determining protein MreC [Lentisphaerota bacterium]HPY90982.1 rod shape-determining protein MreC [Lentisphaeria bacterium]HQC51877.1 rod shape-determining protein MreC [Lentisphaeria bacterium]HQL86401.1 rod shape-determining protein MreC [Lentisphaeria bacterium]
MSSFGRRMALGMAAPFAAAWRTVEDVAVDLFAWVTPTKARQKRHDQELRLRLAEINAAACDSLAQENAELRKILDLPPFPTWRVLVAHVLSRDPATWNWTFTIGKGSADGVTVGAVVLAGSNVIGRVAEVFQQTAVIETIASPSCRFSVAIVDTPFTGIIHGAPGLHGHSPPRCMIDFLPKEAAETNNRLVITSGLGGWIPPGLPVGVITPDESSTLVTVIGQARARAYMTPLADFAVTRFVTVICPVSPKLNP